MSDVQIDKDESKAETPSDDKDDNRYVKPSHFVAVGASAGGLEALQEFFSGMSSESGAAFIVVQHLSPDFKSMMDEILGKHTLMPVANVTDGMTVEANRIYLIPARKHIIIAEGSLYLSEQMPDTGVHLPIDVFLRSLSEDQKHKSIAVILSGTGSDGSRGIKAIKEGAGLVYVQDPQNAKFDGMPYNAVHTGYADFVMTTADISRNLSSYLTHPIISGREQSLNTQIKEQEDTLALVFELLRTKSKIDFAHYKPSTVARRIERRIGINQLLELKDYLVLLRDSPKEIDLLAKELLISVTRFFRDEGAFRFLEEKVISSLVQGKVGKELRVWVAGCCTGEEAYSIAILVSEAMERHGVQSLVKIFATDIDSPSIQSASAAVYSDDIAEDISEERLLKYFTKEEKGYVVNQELRSMVVFATHNMISDPPFSSVDLCVCRNVLIYFQPAIQKKVIAAFHFSLNKGGVAFFGSAESIGELSSYFEIMDERLKIYRKISDERIPISLIEPGKSLMGNTRRLSAGLYPSGNAGLRDPNFEHVKEALLNQHIRSCAVVDVDYNIVHTYGEFSKLLKSISPGRMTANIIDLVLDELTIALSTSLSRSFKDNTPIRYTNIGVRIDGEDSTVNLHTEFHPSNGIGVDCYAVIIEKSAETPSSHLHSGIDFDDGEQSRIRIRDLENELISKQENLQVSNEELETTNEELQAANEELMSSNEELQSTNEELQSVNEELFTVNSEYQEKISELLMSNDDLDNVLQSTSIGIIFLDSGMLIRKYTNVATRFFNIMPADIGRPLHHISHELNYRKVFDDINDVVSNQKKIFKEIFTHSNSPVQVKLLPYYSSFSESPNASDGCIITLTDLESDIQNAWDQTNQVTLKNFPIDRLRSSVLDGASLTALVLDDSESDRIVITRNLNKIDSVTVRSVEASSVAEGIQAMKTNKIDICLVDFRLGLETALEFSSQARALDPDAVIVLLSGFSRSEIEEHMEGASIEYFISKEELSPTLLEVNIKHAIASSNKAPIVV